MKKSSVFLLCLLSLAGCGPAYVKIPHILSTPLNAADTERHQAAQNVYMLIEKPTVVTLDSANFSKQFSQRLARRGGQLAAYRVIKPDALTEDPYTPTLQPSGILRIGFDSLAVKQSEQKKQTKDDKGNAKEIVTWIYSGELSARMSFVALGSSLAIRDQSVVVSQSKEYGALVDQNKQEIERLLVEQVTEALAARLSPLSTVDCERPLLKVKEDKESAAAVKAANRSKWAEAETIWNKRLAEGRGGWRDTLGLAVSAEKRGDYPTAQRLYRDAEQKSQGDADAAKISWSSFHEQISRISTAPVMSAGARAWFAQRVAVLPFSDETVSIDGPELIHQMIFSTFRDGGYSTVALDDVTATLKAHGLTDGAHLSLVKPEQLAKWLNADWLVYGHIEDFNEVNIGVYMRRSITGKIRIWDANKRAEIWSSELPVKEQGIAGGNILANFLSGLGKSWVEHIGKAPMGAQVVQFVGNNMESLPHRPE